MQEALPNCLFFYSYKHVKDLVTALCVWNAANIFRKLFKFDVPSDMNQICLFYHLSLFRRYCDILGLIDPFGTTGAGPCAAGYFCASHSISVAPPSDVLYGNGPCPAGFYCEEG